jgi:hypothetical protein
VRKHADHLLLSDISGSRIERPSGSNLDPKNQAELRRANLAAGKIAQRTDEVKP